MSTKDDIEKKLAKLEIKITDLDNLSNDIIDVLRTDMEERKKTLRVQKVIIVLLILIMIFSSLNFILIQRY